jgi:ribosomal protein S18 acetylase RimI-like enzyme
MARQHHGGAVSAGADDADVDACVGEAFSHACSNQAEWRARKVADPRFDPALWIVARASRDVCGYVIALAVRAPWRRRGLGAALLRARDGGVLDRGRRRVGLGVDSDNATGAVRLYERAGMRVARRDDVYQKEVRA